MKFLVTGEFEFEVEADNVEEAKEIVDDKLTLDNTVHDVQLTDRGLDDLGVQQWSSMY